MRLLTAGFIRAYEGRILNIHPALLPSFKGAHAHRDVLAYGAKVSGCTIHFLVEDMDAGPIILQAAVPVMEGDDEDSLGARVLVEEHKLYPGPSSFSWREGSPLTAAASGSLSKYEWDSSRRGMMTGFGDGENKNLKAGMNMKIKRALISVSDKTGIVEFAKSSTAPGWKSFLPAGRCARLKRRAFRLCTSATSPASRR